VIRAQEIWVRYRRESPWALRGVNCRVQPSELVAIVGPNGSGKTTLLRALLGLVPAVQGRVEIDGRPVAQWTRRMLAQAIGVVTQQEEVVFPISVADTVMLGRYAYLGALDSPGHRDRTAVQTALERCDIASLAQRTIDTLSGGEWKRVRVARALAQQPRALVLDEPTAYLDVRHEMELFELVSQLVKDGLAGLVITHHLNLAARFAHRITLLNHGEVVAEGSPGEVLRKDTLSRVFEWPVAITTWTDGSPQACPHEASRLQPAGLGISHGPCRSGGF
jgi:iron complex transport system ATP-binding protein